MVILVQRDRFTSYRDGSKKSLHQRECLDKSSEAIGQIYPVLRDAEGRVIDGFHRLDADPDWKSVTLENVKTEEDRLLVAFHVNLGRRKVSKAEKSEYINTLAQIYWEQGLRPKAKTEINGRTYYRNEITAKLEESLKGIMSRWGISKFLLPIYKNQELSKAQVHRANKRQNDTPAYELIVGSFGKDIERSFGPGIFGRLEREMFTKAKQDLRNDPWWINKVKDELRAEIRAEVEAEIKAHILAEYGIEDPLIQSVEAVLETLA